MENLYEILQISENASNEIIENAYKTLVKKYHPDIAKDKKKAEEIMKKINNAHDILTNETKKAEYDEKLMQEREKSIIKSNVENPSVYNKTEQRNNNQSNIKNNVGQSNKDEYAQDYDNYYDYINNYNIFKRIQYSSAETKKIVLVIFLVIIFLLIKLVIHVTNLFNFNKENTNVSDNNVDTSISASRKTIENDDNVLLQTESFLNFIKAKNISKANEYVLDGNQISNEKIEVFNNDIDVYGRVLDGFKFEILDYTMLNENEASIKVKIDRPNIEGILSNYIYSKVFSLEYSSINEIVIDKNEIINKLENTNEFKNFKTSFLLNKSNGIWKIKLFNNDLFCIFGTSLESDDFK